MITNSWRQPGALIVKEAGGVVILNIFEGVNGMNLAEMAIRQFEIGLEGSQNKIEAVCVECGVDLVVIVAGGTRYHCGTLALTISMPSIKDPQKLTNSTYQVPVPGHKEEALAREGSLILSRTLQRNVVMSVGIHQDDLPKDRIPYVTDQFYKLVEMIRDAYLRP
jgi:gallate decarboxylase subunit D